jgi:late competence protein required for DNA uptake (superfamily II DNA/RNA helicase)
MQGAGKSGLVFDAMLNIRNKGSVLLEAHPDLEVFRLRLGNALNYEFSEDMQAGLFQRPDPRSGMRSSIDAFGHHH